MYTAEVEKTFTVPRIMVRNSGEPERTNMEMPSERSGDSDWHHPPLVNLDVTHENSNISEAALKRKKEKDKGRG